MSQKGLVQCHTLFIKIPCFLNNRVKIFNVKVQDDEDVKNMFASHAHSRFNFIKLHILLQQSQQPQQSQIIEQSQISDLSQIFDQTEAKLEVVAEVHVIDDEEEESETNVDYMLNNNAEDEDQEPSP